MTLNTLKNTEVLQMFLDGKQAIYSNALNIIRLLTAPIELYKQEFLASTHDPSFVYSLIPMISIFCNFVTV